MIKLYCPICECEREITPIQKEETYPVKGGSLLPSSPQSVLVLYAAKKL